MTATTCADHTYGPDNYVSWHLWAEEKAKTHEQSACDECGLYLIWTPIDRTIEAPQPKES